MSSALIVQNKGGGHGELGKDHVARIFGEGHRAFLTFFSLFASRLSTGEKLVV